MPYSKSKDMRPAEEPATWTMKLREIFEDKAEIARQEDITAQEEMRFGEREPEHSIEPDDHGKTR